MQLTEKIKMERLRLLKELLFYFYHLYFLSISYVDLK